MSLCLSAWDKSRATPVVQQSSADFLCAAIYGFHSEVTRSQLALRIGSLGGCRG